MLPRAKVKSLADQYLSKKLKPPYKQGKLLEAIQAALEQAIQSYHKLCGEFLNLEAVASSDADTQRLHLKEKDILFELLDESLQLKQKGSEGFDFSAFDESHAHFYWMQKKEKLNFRDLRQFHARPENLGLVEKFLKGKLHGQEWLTEVDLRRLLEAYGIKDQVSITRLDPIDLGMVLHFARLKNEATGLVDQPYQIPLLLNKGNSGDASSQGTHWVEAVITVNPQKKEISFALKDSLLTSPQEEKRIQEILERAAHYNVLSQVSGVARRYQAYPGYTVSAGVQSPAVQDNSWSCGYWAIKNLVDENLFKVQQNPALLKLQQAEKTSEHLRACCYQTLLSTQLFSEEAIQESKLDNSLFEEVKGEPRRISADYVADYVQYIGSIKPNRSSVSVSACQLQELKAIQEQAASLVASYKGLIKSSKGREDKPADILPDADDIPVLTSQDVRKSQVSLDFSKIFLAEEKERDRKARMKAWVSALNDFPDATVLKLENLPEAITSEEIDYFSKEFDRNISIQKIICATENSLVSQLEAIAGRNTWLNLIGLKARPDPDKVEAKGEPNSSKEGFKGELDPNEDIWAELWQKRISDGSLNGDRKYITGVLSLNSYGESGKLLPLSIMAMGGRYLSELFKFLQNNRKFFEARESGFSYTALELGLTARAVDEPIAKPEEYQKLNSAYLQVLTQHLNTEQAYFPFKTLELNLNDFTDETFDQLKLLLNAASNYPNITCISLSVNSFKVAGAAEGQNFSEQQYKELKALFKDRKIKFDFKVGTKAPSPAMIEILNIIAVNKREARIEKRAQEMAKDDELKGEASPARVVEQKKEPDFKAEASPVLFPEGFIKKRPYKDKKIDVRKNVVLEVSLEQQVEKEHQHQQQTELQQEIELELQVQEQAQNEIEELPGNFRGQVIDLQGYLAGRAGNEIFSKLTSAASINGSYGILRDLGDVDKLPLAWEKFASTTLLPQGLNYLTPSALSKIEALPQHFWYGFDIDNLPEGFFIQTYQEGLVLCYDETKFIENKNSSPLTIKLTSNSKYDYNWPGDLRGFFRDNGDHGYDQTQISSFDGLGYQGKDNFKAASLAKLHQLMDLIDPELSKTLWTEHSWCLPSDPSRLVLVLENGDLPSTFEYFENGKNAYALMGLLYLEGVEGVKVFLDALKVLHDDDLSLYLHFKEAFIDKKYNDDGTHINPVYLHDLMTTANLDVIRQLGKLQPAEKEWWKHLVSQHLKVDPYANLTDLYQGFRYFLSKLPKGITLPIPCPIDNCNNMLVALSRFLFILGKIRPRNLRDQLENLGGLSFDQNGAWYAVRFNGFRYVHSAMKLSPQTLGPSSHSYQVTYAQLKELALSPDEPPFDHCLTLFHRYLGCADRIHDKYEYYLSLTESLQAQDFSFSTKRKLLALFTLTTTGEVATEPQDPQGLYEFISAHEAELEPILATVVSQIEKWDPKPTLAELSALIKLIHANQVEEQAAEVKAEEKEKAEPPATQVLKILTEQLTRTTWKALSLWESNPQRLKASAYLAFYQKLEQQEEKGDFGHLRKLAALIKDPLNDEGVQGLETVLTTLRQQANYLGILKIVTAIDPSATPPESLPDLSQLNEALQKVAGLQDIRKIFSSLALALPGCVFDRLSDSEPVVLDLSASMQEQILKLNEMLAAYALKPLSMDELKGADSQYIKEKILEPLEAKGKAELGELTWAASKDILVYPKIREGLKGLLFTPLALTLQEFPALQQLQNQDIFPEPHLSGKYDLLGEDYIQLSKYVKNEGEIFELLNDLRKKWGSDFNVDFLRKSPRTQQFTLKQLKGLLEAIKQLDCSYIPNSLLASIFSSSPLEEPLNKGKQKELVTNLVFVLGLTEFTLPQREVLTRILSKGEDPEVTTSLVSCLREIKNQHLAVLSPVFKLFTASFELPDDKAADKKSIITHVSSLLGIIDKEEGVKNILFNRLSAHPLLFNQLCESLPKEDKEDGAFLKVKQDYLKVIAYSCLEQEDEAKQFIGQASPHLLKDLVRLLNERPDFYQCYMELYEKRPYPKLAKLTEFLRLSLAGTVDEAKPQVENYINGYELDPPGLRLQAGTLAAQFDYSSASARIDQIRDLSRESKPLYYSHRKELRDRFIFVNAIGQNRNLSIPGELHGKEAYQKPVKDLKKEEIQTLIKHYRQLISAGLPGEALELAKLEFVALAREAMYRATGKFPYSTQVISLLNILFHGGNIISETRTGEGKSCITALFAVSEWMKGSAVDVCSSNMELAGRDSEEFKDFFEYLGIKSALIKAKSTAESYQQDGINYSDVSELALFQEQMQLKHEKLPEKVSLVLDEADFTTLDNTTQFRYATSLDPSFDPHVNPNAWAYPLILAFVKSPAFLESECDPKQDIENLRQFILTYPEATEPLKVSKSQKAKFLAFSNQQLDKWIDSAYYATQLVENEDYAVRESTIVREGQNLEVQVARVKVNGRVSPDSSFSNGVHQFLHTLLNQEVNEGRRPGKAFPIEPEKTYLASKSAKNFIDYYLDRDVDKRGSVLGLTGTAGSKEEREELRENYGFKFFKIPPHKPLLRVDHKPVLARRKRQGWLWFKKESAEEAHFREILKHVKQSQRSGQPVLLLCEGVTSSQKLYDFLQNNLDPSYLQLYNGEQRRLQEKEVVKKAGWPGMVTVTTELLARGTDIKPVYQDGTPIEEGLAIFDTYIDPHRGRGQKIGRAGRNGAKGLSRLILSEAEFQRYGLPIPRNDEELAVSIELIRARLNKENMKDRREKQYFADVKNQYFLAYIDAAKYIKELLKCNVADYKQVWEETEHSCHLLWEKFLISMDAKWGSLLLDLRNELKANPSLVEEEQLKTKTEALVTFTNVEWGKTRLEIQRESNEKLQCKLAAAKERQASAAASLAPPAAFEHKEDKHEIQPPQVIIEPFSAEPFRSRPSTPLSKEEEPDSLHEVLMDPITVNPAKVYVDRVHSTNPQYLAEALSGEIDIVYAKLVQAKLLAQKSWKAVFGELFPQAQSEPENETAAKLQICFEQILRRYHQVFAVDKTGLAVRYLSELSLQLIQALAAYDPEKAELSKLTCKVYADHIQQHQDEGAYIQGLIHDLYKMREWGAISPETKLDEEVIFNETPFDIWLAIRDYALEQGDKYDSAWFKAGDRVAALKEFKDEIRALDDSDDSYMEKIIGLIKKANEFSLAAATTDQKIDSELSKWSLFSYRNKSGSRFQTMLTKVYDRALAYLTTQSQQPLDFKDEVKHLGALLQILRGRAGLARVRRNSAIHRLAKDATLGELIASLSDPGSNMAKAHEDLAKIQELLAVYGKQVAESQLTNRSSFAFKEFLTDIQVKLHKLTLVHEQVELKERKLPESKHMPKLIYSSVENKLRQHVQAAMQVLMLKIDEGRLEKGDFTQAAVAELERCIKAQFPGAFSIEQQNDNYYNEQKNELSLKFAFKVSREAKEERNVIKLELKSFSPDPAVGAFVLCEWPKFEELGASFKLPAEEKTEVASEQSVRLAENAFPAKTKKKLSRPAFWQKQLAAHTKEEAGSEASEKLKQSSLNPANPRLSTSPTGTTSR